MVLAACVLGSLSMACVSGVLPQDGVEQQGIIRLTERVTGMPYLWSMGVNWLRDRGDPNALTVRMTWRYPAVGCLAVVHEDLAGDLNVDGRVDLLDLAECGRWLLSKPVLYP